MRRSLLEKALPLQVVPLSTGGHLVHSERERGIWYQVTEKGCSCPGYRYHGRCKHALAAELKKGERG